MKKQFFVICAALLFAVVLSSCGSAPSKPAEAPPNPKAAESKEANIEVEPTKQVILDWANRSAGEDSRPSWLRSLVKGNAGPFKEDFGISQDHVVRFTVFQNNNRNVAGTVADVQFAAQLANELKRDVLTEMGASLNDAGEFEAVNNAATRTKLTIAGYQRASDFWQEVETKNLETGEEERSYIYYIVYDFAPQVWDQVVAKYLLDVVGQVPDTKAKQKIGSMLNELKADTQSAKDREEEVSDREWLAEQQARQKAADAIIAKNKAKEAGANAAAAQANAAAIQAAYKSGASEQAAASVAAEDTDWVSALSAASGALF
jgi:hypothetical protein